ncbi:sodium:solute symporter family protein [Candidatus Avelusimicrobium gallicola]|uniref:Sodium:phosphate symporter n=1 Tax=Candidatus Avelusimicrobium gallicola TaxID=2562704 RepID=A0A1Y4DLZ9_9BACT|nr:sodium:solute symporter family protein [Elusimicrobium sp. An273]OUO57320.1 sodium:phosphate symporter [Elusimicrobium sp. An273]
MLNELKTVSYFHWADWAVFFAVLAATAGAAIYGNRRLKKKQGKKPVSVLDYLLMGRQLTLPLFVATLVATWYGGIFGVNEITFNYGIYNFVTQGLFWYAAYLIFAFFIAEKVARYQSMTLPDLTGQMFGPKSAKVAALFTFFYITPVAYVLSLGMFLHMVFGIGILPGMALGTLFAGLYTAWGGFRSVVFSDLVQFFVMCSAVLLVVVFSVGTFGGLDFLKAHLPASHFTLTGGNSWLNTLIWGFIALSTLIDPSFYQRCFAAKNPSVVKKGVLISTFIWFCFDLCTTAGSLYARALLPQAQPGQAYFFYAIQLLPVGLRGFFVAGILSIILSTLNSFLFIASNTLSFDLLRNRFKNVVLSNRIAIFAVGILAILMAHLFHGSFKEIWLVLGSYFSACLLVPILMGYLSPGRISDGLFVFSSLASAAAMTAWRFVRKHEVLEAVDPFYIGVATGLVILILLRRSKNASISRITYR